MSSHMNIYDASGVAVSVDREDPEDLEALAAFQAPRSVNLFAGIRYSLLNQGLDDQQLSNIHTVSFDENKKPSAAFSLFFLYPTNQLRNRPFTTWTKTEC